MKIKHSFKMIIAVIAVITLHGFSTTAKASTPLKKNDGYTNYFCNDSNCKILPIPPVPQQTEVWCWAAVAEMIFTYYSLPNINPYGNFQCGIVALYSQNPYCHMDCRYCILPIGSMTEMNKLIKSYGRELRQLGKVSDNLKASTISSSLDANVVKAEIDNNRPIAAGVSPLSKIKRPNLSEHVVLIIGYKKIDGQFYLVVNDPFPYYNSQNPYLIDGLEKIDDYQYMIAYDKFVESIVWHNSIYKIAVDR